MPERCDVDISKTSSLAGAARNSTLVKEPLFRHRGAGDPSWRL